MSVQTIPVPERLGLQATLELVQQIQQCPAAGAYRVDFTRLTWVEPFGLLLVSHALHELRNRYPAATYTPVIPMSPACSYAHHVGFFTEAGFSDIPAPDPKADTYLPITTRACVDLGDSHHASEIAQHLAKQLLHVEEGAELDAIAYAFQEVLRNVVEHSESEVVRYCAQYWQRGPSKGMVEITLMDNGIGLLQSLRRNPHLQLGSHRDALRAALMPGISGKFYRGVRENPHNVYQNSGFGLYMLYRLCNEGGNFFIGSGDAGLRRAKETENEDYALNVDGTVLRLRVKHTVLRDIRKLLDQFRHDGEVLAADVRNGVIPTIPVMSQMLREDFWALRRPLQAGDQVRHRQYGVGTVRALIALPTGEDGAQVSFRNARLKRVTLGSLQRVLCPTPQAGD